MSTTAINKLRRKIYKLKLKYNSKLPDFLRSDWDKYFRLERQETWRNPRGRDNKVRLRYKGYPPAVDPGYRKPKTIRGLHPSGLLQVMVHNAEELEKLRDKKDKIVVTIARTVGLRKRLEIIKKAQELGFKLTNGE